MTKRSAFEVDAFDKLDRFLILGTATNTAYATGRELTQINADNYIELLKTDHVKTIDRVVEVSDKGLGSKNDYCLFALALAASNDDAKVRSYALSKLNKVARTATHLFMFIEIVKGYRGWGSALKKAVARWYTEKTPDTLAYQVVKYRNRENWTHRDVLRLVHPKSKSPEQETVFRWIVGGMDAVNGSVPRKVGKTPETFSAYQREDMTNSLPTIITSFEEAKTADIDRLITLINGNSGKLPREAIPTEHLTNPAVWEALLESMPLDATIRNLSTMSRVGLLGVSKEATYKVLDRLTDQEYLHKSRIHPMKMLTAYLTYIHGKSFLGTSTWTPINEISNALNDGFYKTFKNVVPTGNKTLYALDVSGSMTGHNIGNIPGLDCRTASIALSLVNANVENDISFIGFSEGMNANKKWQYVEKTSRFSNKMGSVCEIDIDPTMKLSNVMRMIGSMPFAGTDCALPMLYAIDKGIPYENIAIYTDNETYETTMKADAALYRMRDRLKVDTKLAVVGMVANNFSVANPKDNGMMDFAGFSTDTPAAIADFFR